MPSLSEELKHEQCNRVARYLSELRGVSPEGPLADWYDAEKMLALVKPTDEDPVRSLEDWVQKRLKAGFPLEEIVWEFRARAALKRAYGVERKYLAIEAEVDPESLDISLWELSSGKMPGPTAAHVLTVLDGGPEFGRAAFRRHAGNCVRPERVMEDKDGPFHDRCAAVFHLHGGVLLDESRNKRTYQDGCVMAFAQADSAIQAALELRNLLAARNEVGNPGWPDRSHLRVAVAATWKSVIGCLLCAWRGEIVVAPECWPSCGEDAGHARLEGMLLAAGVRAGPGRDDPLPFADEAWATETQKGQ